MLTKLCLVLGLVVVVIVVLFTLGTVGALLTGNIAKIEESQLINKVYLILSVAGEGLALVGLLSGIGALFQKRQLSLTLLSGLILNLLGLLLFLPATLALLFNGFFSLLDYLI